MKNEKLIRQLFVGKVVELLGEERTAELLKESMAAFEEIPKTGMDIVADERERQIKDLGWTLEKQKDHPEWYNEGQLSDAAALYAIQDYLRHDDDFTFSGEEVALKHFFWPWDIETFNPTPKDRIKELAKSGALIAAEIDRLLSSNDA